MHCYSENIIMCRFLKSRYDGVEFIYLTNLYTVFKQKIILKVFYKLHTKM